MSGRRIALAGGGSAGHLFPSLAVAQRIQEIAPDTELLFLGSRRGLDGRLLADLGLPHELLSARPFPYALSPELAPSVAALARATAQALRALRRFRPRALFASGGYVSAPAVLAARLLRVPCVIHVSDALPDRTGRSLSRFATRVTCAFEGAIAHLPRGKAACTGAPLRRELFGHDRAAALRRFGFASGRRTLLAMGGSQGARRINYALLDALPALIARGDLQVLHLTGRLDFDDVLQRAARLGATEPVYQCREFCSDMGSAYAAADVLLTRGGASSLAEGMALAKPMIVVPYPHAAGHQLANARPLVEAGAALIIPDAELSGSTLLASLATLLDDAAALEGMAAAARRVGRADAAERIAQLLLEVAGPLPEGAPVA